jgi:hypothetical protein
METAGTLARREGRGRRSDDEMEEMAAKIKEEVARGGKRNGAMMERRTLKARATLVPPMGLLAHRGEGMGLLTVHLIDQSPRGHSLLSRLEKHLRSHKSRVSPLTPERTTHNAPLQPMSRVEMRLGGMCLLSWGNIWKEWIPCSS